MKNALHTFGSISLADQSSALFNEFLYFELNRGPLHLGSSYIAQSAGDYFVPPSTYGAFALLSGNDGVRRLIKNICPHRQMMLIDPGKDWEKKYQGNTGDRIICRGHAFGFDTCGRHVSPSQHVVDTDELSTHLTNTPWVTKDIGGITWASTKRRGFRSVESVLNIGVAHDVGADLFLPHNYVIGAIRIDRLHCNPLHAMEAYVDCYHPTRPGIHPDTLKRVLVPKSYRSGFAEDGGGDVQIMGWKENCDYGGMHPSWVTWHQRANLFKAEGYTDATTDHIVWRGFYSDFHTNEWYRNMIVDSRFAPMEDGSTWNAITFYFPQELDSVSYGEELKRAAIAAYMGNRDMKGLAAEDAELSEGAAHGKHLLTTFGLGDTRGGPIVLPEEEAVSVLHTYLASKWEAYKRDPQGYRQDGSD